MKISKELRVGSLVAISILVFFAGFYFLRGSNLFSSSNYYHTYYDNVAGLQPSAPVQIKGLQVGKVSDIELGKDGAGRVKVTLEMSDDYTIPQGTVAKLASGDLLGSKLIKLELAAGAPEAQEGSTLPSQIEGGVIDQVSSEITPLLRTIQTVVTHVDSAILSLNTVVGADNQRHVASAIAALDATSQNFARLSASISAQSSTMTSILRNTNSVTSTLSANNAKLDHIFTNLDGVSSQLAAAPIDKTMADLQATTASLRASLDRVNRGEGSLGVLLNDPTFARRLDTLTRNFSYLAEDLKAHPSRYINLTVFGRRARTAQEMGTQR